MTEKGQFVDQKLDDQSPCKTCEVDIKKDVKKAPNLATFKREGGRLGNVKVDSSALRLAARSGGYAAPIVRTVTVQKPEPKPFKVCCWLGEGGGRGGGRLAARSGGYAAPIVRTVTVQKPEPKPFKVCCWLGEGGEGGSGWRLGLEVMQHP